MNFKRIKHIIFRLSSEEKIIGIGALMIIFGSFMPWYSVVLNYKEEGMTDSGFSGDLGVIGFVILLLTLMSLAFMLSDHLNLKLPQFGFKREQIILFLMGESAFLLLLAIAVYTKRSLDYTNASLRFGLYLSFIGAFIGTFASYAFIQKLLKKRAQDFFSNPENEPESDTADTEEKMPEKKSHSNKPDAKNPKPLKNEEQKSFFYENKDVQDDINEPQNELSGTETEEAYFENESDDFIQDEVPEEIDLGISDSAPVINDLDEPVMPDEKSADQANYFMKEAGVKKNTSIKVDINSITTVKKTTPTMQDDADLAKASSGNTETPDKEEDNEKISFYDDL